METLCLSQLTMKMPITFSNLCGPFIFYGIKSFSTILLIPFYLSTIQTSRYLIGSKCWFRFDYISHFIMTFPVGGGVSTQSAKGLDHIYCINCIEKYRNYFVFLYNFITLVKVNSVMKRTYLIRTNERPHCCHHHHRSSAIVPLCHL